MLTPAQYRALNLEYSYQVGLEMLEHLKSIGLATYTNAGWCKIQPACDDAIREYEAAHNITT